VFDVFAGTSTGSIIAAGLANGKSANEIRRLYEEKGSRIFPTSLLCNPLRYLGAFRPAYSGTGLDDTLLADRPGLWAMLSDKAMFQDAAKALARIGR
jgi:patatin-like phospholipase/acyl hydrolase